MSHGHAAQEGEHAAHDPFDRRVAMSMVAIAAILAAVKVLGHRTHNETLAYQIKAGVAHTEESDQWNFFQAKKMREVVAELRASLLSPELARPRSEPEWLASVEKDLEETARDLGKEPGLRDPGPAKEQAAKALEAAKKARDSLKAKAGVPAERVEQFFEAKVQSQRYRAESNLIAHYAAAKHREAKEYHDKSNHAHHRADWFDLGELGVELALVLSSVAILTKRPGYWHAGLAVCALGIAAVVRGFYVH